MDTDWTIDGELTVDLSSNDGSTSMEVKDFLEVTVMKVDSEGNLVTKGVITERFRGDIP